MLLQQFVLETTLQPCSAPSLQQNHPRAKAQAVDIVLPVINKEDCFNMLQAENYTKYHFSRAHYKW
jgi:hypothetical protein